MGYEVLRSGESFWRPSNQMGVANTDIAKQLGAETMGARLWRLEPGQASTRHRHIETTEIYTHVDSRRLVELVNVRHPLVDVRRRGS